VVEVIGCGSVVETADYQGKELTLDWENPLGISILFGKGVLANCVCLDAPFPDHF
jgi:hypothetical protein